jgi:hypothetical protein
MRKYKSGTGWCVWRWSDIESKYIRRLHLIKTPLGAVCIHWILKADPELYVHDHPVTFLSLFIRGQYYEYRGPWDKFRGLWQSDWVRKHKWFNFIRATDTHSIFWTDPKTITICFMGPKRQEWGFFLPKGKLYWKDYYDMKKWR